MISLFMIKIYFIKYNTIGWFRKDIVKYYREFLKI